MLRPGIVGMRGSYHYGRKTRAMHEMSIPPSHPPPLMPPFDATVRNHGRQESLGLLDSPVPSQQSPLLNQVGGKEDREAALMAARESITLLKNRDMKKPNHNNDRGGAGGDGGGPALPLARSRTKKLLLVGPACDSLQLQSGGWTKHWQVRRCSESAG